MKFFVKSAGRKASQDYVWKPVEPLGADSLSKAELELLTRAEKSTSNRGRVGAFAGDCGCPSCLFAIFFGNIDSGRSDFYGTPILNRIGFIFDAQNGEDVRFALNLSTDWYSLDSALERLLMTGTIASEEGCGFAFSQSFADAVKRVADNSRETQKSPDFDRELFESIMALSRLSSKGKSNQGHIEKGNTMKIFINTVPSGMSDYGWYVGGRPPYADRLCDICEHVAAVTADAAFFAALSREEGAWVVFVQDIIGRDLMTQRPARGTVAIEIPCSDKNASAKARRLLRSWLLPDGKLLEAVKRLVDVSGEEVKADMPALVAAADAIASDTSVALKSSPMPLERVVFRIDRSRTNIDSLRRDSAQFVSEHSLADASGVQFLFTNSAYSSRQGAYDAMPDIPAKYIVAGYRMDEPPTRQETTNAEPKQSRPPTRNTQTPFSPKFPAVVYIGIAVVVVILLWILWPKSNIDPGKEPEIVTEPAVAGSSSPLQQGLGGLVTSCIRGFATSFVNALSHVNASSNSVSTIKNAP